MLSEPIILKEKGKKGLVLRVHAFSIILIACRLESKASSYLTVVSMSPASFIILYNS